MPAPFSPPDVVLLVLCAGSIYTDITTQKIRNVLTFPVMATGIAMAPLYAAQPYDGVLGLLAAFAVAVPGWKILPAIKAGDVKMLMAAGSLMDPERAILAVLWTYVLGLPAGIVVLAMRGRLGNLWRFFRHRDRSDPTVVAHAPVVALGILAARVLPFPDPW
jgi:Flp pilus assembly protein protease CpaA